MKRVHAAKLLLSVIVGSLLANQSIFAQNIAITQTPSNATPNAISQISGVIRIPLGALRIEIDDENQPFRLVNLDKRFDAESLARFLAAYVEKSRHVTIMVTSNTKRLVKGEEEFNRFLEKLGKGKKVLILHMPQPTGFDADAELREFAATFLTDSNSTQVPEPQTKR